jgi:hypothetical protein
MYWKMIIQDQVLLATFQPETILIISPAYLMASLSNETLSLRELSSYHHDMHTILSWAEKSEDFLNSFQISFVSTNTIIPMTPIHVSEYIKLLQAIKHKNSTLAVIQLLKYANMSGGATIPIELFQQEVDWLFQSTLFSPVIQVDISFLFTEIFRLLYKYNLAINSVFIQLILSLVNLNDMSMTLLQDGGYDVMDHSATYFVKYQHIAQTFNWLPEKIKTWMGRKSVSWIHFWKSQ